MTQTPQVGLPEAVPEPHDEMSAASRRVVVGVAFVAMLSVVATWLWFDENPGPSSLIDLDQTLPVAGLLVVAVLSELMFFPVRHGDGFEELTYFEFVMIGALLLFTPTTALPALLAGTALAEWILHRPDIKRLFNMGSYGIATSALFLTYWALADPADRFSLQSIVALFVAALVWGTINLVLLSWILQVAEGIPIREFLADKGNWFPTLIVAFLSVSVAASFVALIPVAPALTVFTVVPTAALWFVYQAAQRRSDAVERVRHMVDLSNTLATPDEPDRLISGAADTVRRFFGAQNVMVVTEGVQFVASRDGGRSPAVAAGKEARELAEYAGRTARSIPPFMLPAGWRGGTVIRLDLTSEDPSALALGTTTALAGLEQRMPWARGGRYSWTLKSDDLPVLAGVAGSLSSAIRASQHLSDLRDETAKLTAVVDHATDGIAVFDDAGSVVLWSPAMVVITGVTAPEHPDGAAAAVLESLSGLRGSNSAGHLLSITRPDGDCRELDVAVVAIDDKESMSVLTVRDVTQQRRVERMKSDFIAQVSHEMRTPITPIKGYAQLLASNWERMKPAKRETILATIEERANHLSRLVDDLLIAQRASNVEAAQLDVQLEAADLAGLVHKAVDSLPDLGPRITVTGTDITITCDAERTHQCLTNLITNADKYSPRNSPIRVEFGPVEGERWAKVDVIDQGRGIPADEVEKVFEKFYRVEDPMTMTTSGNGLGLFISRELARAMNGDITVRSTLGSGSSFELRLPVDEGTV